MVPGFITRLLNLDNILFTNGQLYGIRYIGWLYKLALCLTKYKKYMNKQSYLSLVSFQEELTFDEILTINIEF